jgi:glutamine synthetase type III
MDPYSMERWILERHQAVIRTAEVRARVGAVEAPPRRISVWLAGNLRHLADRLDHEPDGQRRFERVGQ